MASANTIYQQTGIMGFFFGVSTALSVLSGLYPLDYVFSDWLRDEFWTAEQNRVFG